MGSGRASSGEAHRLDDRNRSRRAHALTYDPFEHAHDLGLRVVHQTLRTTNGLYIPDEHLIVLKRGLRTATERCVLAHEIAHHLHGDRKVAMGPWSLKQERRADLAAARRLIDPNALFELQRTYPDPGAWAASLDVTGDILLAYLRAA